MQNKSKKKLLAFSVIELLISLMLIGILSYMVLLKPVMNDFDIAVKRLYIYLKQTRLQAFIHNQYESNDPLWHKKRWTLKFMRCNKNKEGLYYVIYSDTNQTGHPSLNESLQDPLTKKYIYSTNRCEENTKTSPYVLLSHKYNIMDVKLSCNNTSSLGQLSFGSDGKVYTKLSNLPYDISSNELITTCQLELIHKNKEKRTIIIHGKTGYIELK
jgi:type II secretory pathway pseudopilin PulG